MSSAYMAALAPRLMVSRPNALQFGHLGLEIVMALATARERKARLWLVPSGDSVNPALYHVESDEVPMRRCPALVRPLADMRLAIAGLTTRRDEVIEALFDEAARELTRHANRPGLPSGLTRDLGRLKRVLGHRTGGPRAGNRMDRPPYFLRRLVRVPIRTRLSPSVAARARTLASRAGIPDEGPLVTIHARESGFKGGGREVHEKRSRDDGSQGVRDDSLRNSRIETLYEVIDFLLARGFTIVRLGDATMTPIARRGVIDVATSPYTDPLLQVYCLFRSRFLICGESGPTAVAYLTNTPTLNVNVTDPIGSYPVRSTGLFLPKRVFDAASGAELDPSAMLSSTYHRYIRNPKRFHYMDNTPGELYDATREMMAMLDGAPETPEQSEYRRLATTAGHALRSELAYVWKWGSDRGFLGDGRLVQTAARRCARPSGLP